MSKQQNNLQACQTGKRTACTVPAPYAGHPRLEKAWLAGYTLKVRHVPGMTVGMGSESEACRAGYDAAGGEQPPKRGPLYPDGATLTR